MPSHPHDAHVVRELPVIAISNDWRSGKRAAHHFLSWAAASDAVGKLDDLSWNNAAPHHFVAYLNKHMAKAKGFVAAVKSADQMTSEEFFDLIKKHIDDGLPLALYAYPEPSIAIITVVGYQESGVGDARIFLLPDRSELALKSLFRISEMSFFKEKLRRLTIDAEFANVKTPMAATSEDMLKQLRAYNFIVLERSAADEPTKS
jgi:hypothetical protein